MRNGTADGSVVGKQLGSLGPKAKYGTTKYGTKNDDGNEPVRL